MTGFVGDSGGSGEDVAAGRDVLDGKGKKADSFAALRNDNQKNNCNGKGKTAAGPSTRLRSLRMTISISFGCGLKK